MVTTLSRSCDNFAWYISYQVTLLTQSTIWSSVTYEKILWARSTAQSDTWIDNTMLHLCMHTYTHIHIQLKNWLYASSCSNRILRKIQQATSFQTMYWSWWFTSSSLSKQLFNVHFLKHTHFDRNDDNYFFKKTKDTLAADAIWYTMPYTLWKNMETTFKKRMGCCPLV